MQVKLYRRFFVRGDITWNIFNVVNSFGPNSVDNAHQGIMDYIYCIDSLQPVLMADKYYGRYSALFHPHRVLLLKSVRESLPH